MKITNALLAAILVAATVVDGIPTMRFRSEKKSTAGAAGDETTAATDNGGLSLACKDSAYLIHGECERLTTCDNETEYLEKKKTRTSDRVCKVKICTCSDPHGTGNTGAACAKNGTEGCGDCKRYKTKANGTCVDSTEGQLEVKLKSCKCSDADYLGSGDSDVYCEVSLQDDDSGRSLMGFRTEIIDNDNDPVFYKKGFSTYHDFKGKLKLKISCYDWDPARRFMGFRTDWDDDFGTKSELLTAIDYTSGTRSITVKMENEDDDEQFCNCEVDYTLRDPVFCESVNSCRNALVSQLAMRMIHN